MIPLKLQLKNFLSYGAAVQTIDFSPYNLICLSGKNGHGKSALLDAITWAIWGQARKVSGASKADAHLLHLGQTQMMVCLDFSCNGQVYRVRREYAKTYGKPHAALDFGILNQQNDTVISLTDKTIRTTQQKIERTIHLTFEVFVNSAFLRQGQANEFSKKSPKDRKEIFAQILGLQQYESIRKLAMEKSRDAYAKKACVLTFQEKRETELQKTETITAQIKHLESNLLAIIKKETAIQQDQKKLHENKISLVEQQKEQQLLLFQQKEWQKKEQEQQTDLQEIRTAWKKIHQQQLNMPDQSVLEKERKELLKRVTKQQKIIQRRLELKEQQLHYRATLQQQEKQCYEQQMAITQKKKIALERLFLTYQTTTTKIKEETEQLQRKQQEEEKLKKEIKELASSLTAQAVDEKKHALIDKQFIRRKDYYQRFIAQGNLTKQQLDALHQKELLSHDDDNPSCPLCEQNLSASRKRFLKIKFIEQKKVLTNRLKRLTRVIKKLKSILIDQHNILEEQKKRLSDHAQRTLRIADLTKNTQTTQDEINTIKQRIVQKKEIAKLEVQQGQQKKTQTAASNKLLACETRLNSREEELKSIVPENARLEKENEVLKETNKKLVKENKEMKEKYFMEKSG